MRIHHLNCGSLRPLRLPTEAVIYVLLVETNHGLVLVDTGLGTRDYVSPSPKLSLFLACMGVRRDPAETAIHQLRELGFASEKVRHIVLTHLHFDHAGGLADFPEAQVHVARPEHQAAMSRRGNLAIAYEPGQWAHGPHWVLHASWTRDWHGFECASILEGLVPEILLVPLRGHTAGHCGVAIQQPTGWLLQCGDAASPYHPATHVGTTGNWRRGLHGLPPGFIRRVIGPHVSRLRELAREHGDQVTMISAHDQDSYLRYRTV